jgi:hypothetical protein
MYVIPGGNEAKTVRLILTITRVNSEVACHRLSGLGENIQYA